MKKKIYYIRLLVALLVMVLAIGAFYARFYPVKIFDIQLTALWQRVMVDFSLFAVLLTAVLLLITFLGGRLYCSTLCPLGIFQELLMLIFRRKNSYQPNCYYKYFLAALLWGTLLGGTVVLLRLIDPYTIFGSALSLTLFGLVFVLILSVLVWFKGRWFCTHLCPVGVVLGLVSKVSLSRIYIKIDNCVSCGACASKCPSGSIDFKHKTVDNETCVKCLKCLGTCPKSALTYGIKPTEKVAFNPSRRKFIVGAAAVAVLAAAVKGGAVLAQNTVAKIKKVILPAGAGNAEDFANRCLNCNLCVQNCPMKIIKKADKNFGTVHIDYENSFCDYDCHKCSEVCPSGAIKKITLAQKQKTQIGLAKIDENICVKCGLYVMKCPRGAIRKPDGAYPLVDADVCIGCGACKIGCPVKAIAIEPKEVQKVLA